MRCFSAFFEMLSSRLIWQSMRLHELMHLQLQFYKPKTDSLDVNPEHTKLTFIQQTHTH